MSPAQAEKESQFWRRRMVAQQVLTALGGFYSDDKLVALLHQMELFGGPLCGASGARWRAWLASRMQARTCRCHMQVCACA